MGDEMNLCAEMHSLLASIQDKAARLGRRISLLELQQRVDRLRRRLEVLEAAHQVGDGEDHFGEDAAPMFSPRLPLRLTLTMTVTLTSLRKRQRKSTSIQMLNLALTKRLTTTCSLIAAAHGAVF